MKPTRLFLLLLATSTVAVACLDDSITGTRPLTISVSASPQTALVDSIILASYAVTGTGLLGVIMNWGDGAVDSIAFSGLAVEATGNFEHAYSLAGAYDIVGTAEAQNGILSSQTTVQIN